MSGMLNVSSNTNPLHAAGAVNTLALMFNTSWVSAQFGPNATYPPPYWAIPNLMIPDPSKLDFKDGVIAIWAYGLGFGGPSCADQNITSLGSFGNLPDNIGLALIDGGACYVFAKIKYSAGVKTCLECEYKGGSFTAKISDPSFASQQVLADPMVAQALRMIPETVQFMTVANISLPTLWNNIEDYSKEMLRRAYCVSWTALNALVGGEPPFVTTPVQISVPSTVARVSLERVYAWFALQVLAVISGAMFVVVQSMAKNKLVDDTAMEMFLLDTREVKAKMDNHGFEDSTLRKRGLLRIEKGNDSNDYDTVRYNIES